MLLALFFLIGYRTRSYERQLMIPGMDNDAGVGEVEVELHRRTRMRVSRHIHYMQLYQSCTAVQITAH